MHASFYDHTVQHNRIASTLQQAARAVELKSLVKILSLNRKKNCRLCWAVWPSGPRAKNTDRKASNWRHSSVCSLYWRSVLPVIVWKTESQSSEFDRRKLFVNSEEESKYQISFNFAMEAAETTAPQNKIPIIFLHLAKIWYCNARLGLVQECIAAIMQQN